MSWLSERAAHRQPRPYTVADLAVAIGLDPQDPRLTSQLVRSLGMSRGWVLRCRTLGLTEQQADEWAIRAGIHPGDVWARWYDNLRGVALVNAYRRTCPLDHPYDRVDSNGRRRCSTCLREVRRRYKKSVNVQAVSVIPLNTTGARHPQRIMVCMDIEEPAGTDWLTVKEAAAELRVHPDSVYDACAAGTLHHVRVGRTIRINRTTLTGARSTEQTA